MSKLRMNPQHLSNVQLVIFDWCSRPCIESNVSACILSHCFTSHVIISYDITSPHIASHCFSSHHNASHRFKSLHIASYRVTSHNDAGGGVGAGAITSALASGSASKHASLVAMRLGIPIGADGQVPAALSGGNMGLDQVLVLSVEFFRRHTMLYLFVNLRPYVRV